MHILLSVLYVLVLIFMIDAHLVVRMRKRASGDHRMVFVTSHKVLL